MMKQAKKRKVVSVSLSGKELEMYEKVKEYLMSDEEFPIPDFYEKDSNVMKFILTHYYNVEMEGEF